MKFSFVAKHRVIWPAGWLCEALGVSRGGFYAWLTRPRSARARSNEELGAKVRASFLASDRTYGARRVWHDMLADGVSCSLHRIERLMRQQALKQGPDDGVCRPTPVSAPRTRSRRMFWTVHSKLLLRTANGLRTSPTFGRPKAGSMLRRSSICSPGALSAGR